MSEISNTADIIDSRDILNRINELIQLRDELDEAKEQYDELVEQEQEAERNNQNLPADLQSELDAAESYLNDCLSAFGSEEGDELETLEDVQDQASYGDWRYGTSLIHEDYFVEHAKQLADDLGDMDEQRWPYTNIDWEGAAEDLKHDYTAIDFDGETYYIR